jgi:hypothetical protein
MSRDEIEQIVIDISDKLYNNPQNMSNPLSNLNYAVEIISATILKNVEELIIEVLYKMQEHK